MVATPRIETDEHRWSQVCARDRSARAAFVYAVRTTGVYCRAGCSSRLPRRENVSFFETVRLAQAAGFRACQKCSPDELPDTNHEAAVQTACRLMDAAERPLSLEHLASSVNYSPSHFRRVFKRLLGVTPHAWSQMRRAARLRDQLPQSRTVADAAYQAGFGTSSQFYEEASDLLGMSPSEYRSGAPGLAVSAAIVSTSLGPLLIAATGRGLCAVEFGDDEATLQTVLRERFPHATLSQPDPFQSWVDQIVSHIDQGHATNDLPLDIRGTAFQKKVWDAMRKIPVGQTWTYAELAREIEQPTAARAVARACAANPTAIVVPCHRIVRSDGTLGGYRWGTERKQVLLDRESDTTS